MYWMMDTCYRDGPAAAAADASLPMMERLRLNADTADKMMSQLQQQIQALRLAAGMFEAWENLSSIKHCL